MLTILRAIAQQLKYRLAIVSTTPPPEDWQIYFHPHAAFPPALLAYAHRGAIVIRDPRDVIVSGAYYHCRTDANREPWLYKPDNRFGGRSYHEAITALDSEEERLIFELRHFGRTTLLNMQKHVTLPREFIHTRLEDLVADTELREFRRVFTWLGLPDEQLPRALEIAEAASVFSSKADVSHVRSGTPEQWRKHFTPRVHAAFRNRFGDLAERLGYPPA